MDLSVRVPGLEKLVDYVASGVGSVAGPMLPSWRARKEADARRIAARGEADALAILAEGQAGALSIIATAQEHAQQQLAAPGFTVRGDLTITEAIEQRVRFQEEKRQQNISSVVNQAAAEIAGTEVPDHEPDHDWTARFFSEVQDVSSEEMQSLWAKVLAGEVERPGSTSIRTLDILRNLDRVTAQLFSRLCSVCVFYRIGEDIEDARALSLGGNAGNNALKEYGLGFGELNLLNEHGLIISEYNSWRDYRACVGMEFQGIGATPQIVYIPIRYQGKYWVLKRTSGTPSREFKLHGVSLTKSGAELSSVVSIAPLPSYSVALAKFFESKKLRMIEVSTAGPQVLDA